MNPTDLPLDKIGAIGASVIVLIIVVLYFQERQFKHFMETLKHLFKRNGKD
jgi:hypothetical protein